MDMAESWRVIDERRVALADLLDHLTPAEWDAPSLCDGWTVKDVAAHLSLAATMSYAEMVAAAVSAREDFDAMIRQTAVARAVARSTEQAVADLRSVVGSRRLAPMTTWRDPCSTSSSTPRTSLDPSAWTSRCR